MTETNTNLTDESLAPADEFDCAICNFEYNGFYGKKLEGDAAFRGKFVRWTDDPGIAVMECSDGNKRLIPSFAVTSRVKVWPKQKKGTVMFGMASSSK